MKTIVSLALIGLALSAAGLSAQITLFSYGESTEYVESTNYLSLVDGVTDAEVSDFNRAFSDTSNMNPEAPGYTGPAFFGGWETTGSLAQNLDNGPYIRNDWIRTGDSDGIFFDLNHNAFQEGRAACLFMGDTASTNLSDLTSFIVNAGRNTGDGNFMSVRAIIRVDGTYYASDTDTLLAGGYNTDVSLSLTNWKNYDPSTSIMTIGGPVTLSGSAQVTAVGVLLYRGVSTITGVQGDVWMTLGKFVATAADSTLPPIPALSTSTSAGNLVITVPSQSGFDYQLETATSGLGGWTDVVGEVQSGTDSDLTFTQPLPAAGAQEFYRIDVTAQ